MKWQQFFLYTIAIFTLKEHYFLDSLQNTFLPESKCYSTVITTRWLSVWLSGCERQTPCNQSVWLVSDITENAGTILAVSSIIIQLWRATVPCNFLFISLSLVFQYCSCMYTSVHKGCLTCFLFKPCSITFGASEVMASTERRLRGSACLCHGTLVCGDPSSVMPRQRVVCVMLPWKHLACVILSPQSRPW